MEQLQQSEFTPVEYALLETEYVKNSPYRLEGNEDVVLGIPQNRNLPFRYNITHSGKARKIRLIIGCDTPFVDEQIKLGEAAWAERKVTEEELDALRIKNGTLVALLPEVAAYINLLPHNASSSTPIPRGKAFRQLVKVRNVEEETNEELDFALKISEATELIKSWDLKKMKDVLRVRYSTPAGDIKENKARLSLINIAQNEKGGLNFILSQNGEMKEDDKVVVLVTKAIEYGLLSLAQKNKVSVVNKNGKFSPIASINDESTRDGKMNTFCQHLRSDAGKALLRSIGELVDEHESGLDSGKGDK